MARISSKHRFNDRPENICNNEKGEFPQYIEKCKSSRKMKKGNAKVSKT